MPVDAEPTLIATDFQKLGGWKEDDHAAVLRLLVSHCQKTGRQDIPNRKIWSGFPDSLIRDLKQVCTKVLSIVTTSQSQKAARTFFEDHFLPVKILLPGQNLQANGFVTAYYEPELSASRTKTEVYKYPLHGKPSDLVKITDAHRPANFHQNLTYGRKTNEGIVPYPTRKEIENGQLYQNLPAIAWLSDPVEAFFVHIQGAARLQLTDGTVARIGYAAKNGHTYLPIGRILIEDDIIPRDEMTAETLRQWLYANPHLAHDLMQKNPSYIFFRNINDIEPKNGPIGAAGLPLTAGRSLAIDSDLYPFGIPIFVEADFQNPDHLSIAKVKEGKEAGFSRLMITEDTGSAIKGHGRGDLYFGAGVAAGKAAGEIRHPATMTILLPKQ